MMHSKVSENTSLQEKKDHFIQELTDFKNRKSDIPEQIIHSFSDDPEYKIRK